MRRLLRSLRHDRRGVSAIEFALLAPLLIVMIMGVSQMGALFYGHAALRNAISEGARYATIHPRPTAAQVVDRVNANRPSVAASNFGTPTVAYVRNTATGYWNVTVAGTYTMNLDFVFFRMPVTMNYSRQANVYAPAS
jgi:Flp pilus assembly protein TadG